MQSDGGFILKRLNKEVCSVKFKDCEKQTISTHGKLFAVKYVLDSFREMLQDQSVQVSTLQTLHLYYTLKRRGNGRFHVVST